MTEPLTRAEEAMLLGRAVEPLLTAGDRDACRSQRYLVTGAGGSVGSELARQIASCDPLRLTLVDQSEHGLFSIEQELRERHPRLALEAVLCDITRTSSVREAVRRGAPDVVLHAAAYKHVTMAERAVCAAARVNVLGTAELLTALRGSGTRFVLISSDKAAAPRGVMGATKRFAELLTAAHANCGLTPVVVRFGNVLASSGSVVAIMLDRLQRGQPLLLTDPEATRYFMSLSEAASLVIKAGALGEAGDTLWLDMGQQMRMGEVVTRIFDVAAARGWARVPVEIIGLRPGEKRVERLMSDGVAEAPTAHPRIRVARLPHAPSRRLTARKPPPEMQLTARKPPPDQLWRWDLLLRTLRLHVGRENVRGTLDALQAAVADFEPSDETVASACGAADDVAFESGVRTA